MKVKNKKRKKAVIIISALVAVLIFGLATVIFTYSFESGGGSNFVFEMKDKGLNSYPEKLVKLYRNNKEARDYVLSYFDKKDKKFSIDLKEYIGKDKTPLLMQWDERWGYSEYAGNLFGLSGCGPTCLSMVALQLSQDKKYTPLFMAEFAEENGYCEKGNGTLWTLFSEGAVKLGFNVEVLPLWEFVIKDRLEKGIPIVCNVGKGVFTESGHYIVFTKYDDGLIYVNDPNRKSNSKGWKYDEISDQIKNMWAISQ